MLFLGGKYEANTLKDWGLVNQVVSNENFLTEVMDFAGKLSRRPHKSVAQLKRLANMSLTTIPFEERINEEAIVVKQLYLDEEAQLAIKKFIKKSEQ